MILERFCHRHGTKDTAVSRTDPPPELLAMAQIVVPRLCLRLQQQLKQIDPYTIGMFNITYIFFYWGSDIISDIPGVLHVQCT